MRQIFQLQTPPAMNPSYFHVSHSTKIPAVTATIFDTEMPCMLLKLRQAVEFLNPGQIPVVTADQPLFALAKFVQWKWPNIHGEQIRRYVRRTENTG